MNYIYKLNLATVVGEDEVLHTTYGIEAYQPGENSPIRTISGIFMDRGEAERFIRACNLLALDIDHLDDVVCDVINA